jgi:hypothetical protein
MDVFAKILRWLLYATAAILSFVVSEWIVSLFLSAVIKDFDKLLAGDPNWWILKIALIAVATISSLWEFIRLINKLFPDDGS